MAVVRANKISIMSISIQSRAAALRNSTEAVKIRSLSSLSFLWFTPAAPMKGVPTFFSVQVASIKNVRWSEELFELLIKISALMGREMSSCLEGGRNK